METLNIIWSVTEMQYIGMSDDVEANHSNGVKTFEAENTNDLLKIADDWNAEKSVYYGEEGGHFKIKGAFFGDFSNVITGKRGFCTEKQFHNLLNIKREEREAFKEIELEAKARGALDNY